MYRESKTQSHQEAPTQHVYRESNTRPQVTHSYNSPQNMYSAPQSRSYTNNPAQFGGVGYHYEALYQSAAPQYRNEAPQYRNEALYDNDYQYEADNDSELGYTSF